MPNDKQILENFENEIGKCKTAQECVTALKNCIKASGNRLNAINRNLQPLIGNAISEVNLKQFEKRMYPHFSQSQDELAVRIYNLFMKKAYANMQLGAFKELQISGTSVTHDKPSEAIEGPATKPITPLQQAHKPVGTLKSSASPDRQFIDKLTTDFVQLVKAMKIQNKSQQEDVNELLIKPMLNILKNAKLFPNQKPVDVFAQLMKEFVTQSKSLQQTNKGLTDWSFLEPLKKLLKDKSVLVKQMAGLDELETSIEKPSVKKK